jgi:hypothetical protein
MKRHTRLNQEKEGKVVHQEKGREQTAVEFADPETMLRYDAAQTVVPAALAERLSNSVENEPKPPRTWWRRLFGGS